jgi:hypothetical protein
MAKTKPETKLVPVAKVLPAVERSAEGLRDALFDELNLLRSGEATTGHARALCNVARLIVETARLEVQQLKEVRQAAKSLRLGTGK